MPTKADSSSAASSELGHVQCPAGSVASSSQARAAYVWVKRILDLVIVLITAPAVLLVLALAAMTILLAMGRPILFIQERVGYGGRIFRMMKLRTMAPRDIARATATESADPRITPLGRFLRHSHIDELPQLWNVLRGDMTLIGPRPEQPHLVDYYRSQIPRYDLRHTVQPGLSGWSQVCYGYAANLAETEKKFTYDLHYVENFGPKIDLVILARTITIFMDPNYVR